MKAKAHIPPLLRARRAPPLPRRQSGAVLVISLLILLIMTLVGVTAMNSTTLEEKMAGNMRDRNVALQASETMLETAEETLDALSVEPAASSSCAATTCVWPRGTLPDLASQTAAWWTSNGLEYGTGGAADIDGVTTDPYYVVEAQAYIPDSLDMGQGTKTGKHYYRLTARGTGATDEAQVILQSTFVKRFN